MVLVSFAVCFVNSKVPTEFVVGTRSTLSFASLQPNKLPHACCSLLGRMTKLYNTREVWNNGSAMVARTKGTIMSLEAAQHLFVILL